MNEPASQGDGRPLASIAEDQSPISPNKVTEPTSVQNLPLISTDQGSLPSLPFHVAIGDGGLEIDAKIKNEADVDRLIQILQTIKPLLQSIYGRQPSAFVDPPDPPYLRPIMIEFDQHWRLTNGAAHRRPAYAPESP